MIIEITFKQTNDVGSGNLNQKCYLEVAKWAAWSQFFKKERWEVAALNIEAKQIKHSIAMAPSERKTEKPQAV